MPKTDFDWVKSQFKGDKTKRAVALPITTLLESWKDLEIPDDLISEVLEKFTTLAKGHALFDPEPETKWLSGINRTPGVGDTVRVPLNYYTGRRQELNGRVGRVVGIRYGDIIVNTTDDGPYYEGVRFRSHELEIKPR